MKLNSAILIAASVLSFVACSEKSQDNSAETATVNDITPAATTPGTATASDLTTVQPADAPATGPVTTSAAPVSSSAPASGLNPAHGQPGHRCDIEVGAPLNSPATKPGAAATTTAPSPISVTQDMPAINSNATVAPGTNPPHGQPGHDCAVAVGAPLKK